jgi:hypothetical protein
MRPGVVGLFLCIPLAALCQPVPPRAAAPQTVGNGQQATPPWTACSHLAPAVSMNCVAPQVEPGNVAQSAFSLTPAQASRVLEAQNYPILLQPPSSPLPNAKGEPIPTQWPKARIEQIPTTWPHLQSQQIDGQSSSLAASSLAMRTAPK